jgi:hypothetical protein
MVTDNRESLIVNPADTSGLLKGLNDTLAQYMQNLEKHNTHIDALNEAIKQLDITVKKVSSLERTIISLQLKESLATFAEYQINPQFYHNDDAKVPVKTTSSH